tara:strand:+ start:148 stop:675 length:528 start_codon:yes stop_codon:yes gene_type:complete
MIFKGNKKYVTSKSNWKKIRVLDNFNDNYKTLFRIYMSTKFCDTCGIGLIEGIYGANKKCFDHCHKSGYFRQVLCNTCNSRDGRSFSERKENNNEQKKQYYLQNREKMNEKNKEWCLKNKERRKERNIEWRLENREKHNEYDRKYYLENRQRINERNNKNKRWKKIQQEFLNINI